MFTLQDILSENQLSLLLHGAVPVQPDLLFRQARHDSRLCGPGDLFVALRGAHSDGHVFIPEVARAGAAGVLCSTPHPDAPEDFLQIVVPDVIKALQATARARVRRQPGTKKIAITGSSGKTTTKEALATVLQTQAPTLKTYASYNNELGYPLTLLRLEEQEQYAVLEMGAEWVGELRDLCETCASPDWSVITTVGAAHLKHFGSLANVARAKSELVQVLSDSGIAFLNYDDPAVRAMQEQTRARVVFYGQGTGAMVRGTQVTETGLAGSHFTLRIGNDEMRIQLQLPGEHGITTALAAAAAGHAAGIPLEAIGQSLETLQPGQGRGQIKQAAGPNGSTLIDDTYNAIRPSIIVMAHAMQVTPLAPGGKRWAVLGELLEQGEYAQREHYLTGKALPGQVDFLVTIGDFARFYGQGAQNAGMPAAHIYHFPADPQNQTEVEASKREAALLLTQKVLPRDLVLVKGSRGMRMETMLALF